MKAKWKKLWGKSNRQQAIGRCPRSRRKPAATTIGFYGISWRIRILDPPAGGNFLYVTINLLLDLEGGDAYAPVAGGLLPQVRPTQLAASKSTMRSRASGHLIILQWMHHNGFTPQSDP